MISKRRLFRWFVCLTFFYHSTAMSASPIERDESANLSLSVTVQEKDCSFTVALKNTSSKPVKYVDMLKPRSGSLNLPGATEILVRDRDHRILSGINGKKEGGYSWAVFQSQAYPVMLAELRPGDEVSIKSSLKLLCIGLFEKTSVRKKDAQMYEFKLRAKVFLDADCQEYISSETQWSKFPACLCQSELKP